MISNNNHNKNKKQTNKQKHTHQQNQQLDNKPATKTTSIINKTTKTKYAEQQKSSISNLDGKRGCKESKYIQDYLFPPQNKRISYLQHYKTSIES